MALPKLNSSPSYELTIPSTGQQVHFRPFLVKEQKNLLIAMETQDKKGLVRAITNTIESCVEDKIKGKLTTFDVDYVFTQIRAKSVGETTDLIFKCVECEEQNEIVVHLDEVKVEGDKKDLLVQLSDDISLELRYPTYDDFLNNKLLMEGESSTETIIELILTCLEAFSTEEERSLFKDEKREDVIEFIESMTTSQFDILTDFVQSIPSVYKDIEYNCKACGTTKKTTLKGLDDFF